MSIKTWQQVATPTVTNGADQPSSGGEWGEKEGGSSGGSTVKAGGSSGGSTAKAVKAGGSSEVALKP